MKLYEYEMSDKSKKYTFYMTNAAKREIEETQTKQLELMGNSDYMVNVTKMQRLNTALARAKASDENEKAEEIQNEIDELQASLIKHVGEITKLTDTDIEEIPFILLRNHRDNRDITREEYQSLMDDMENELGFEKFNDKLIEVAGKVFSLIGTVNDHKQKALQQEKAPKQTVPVS